MMGALGFRYYNDDVDFRFVPIPVHLFAVGVPMWAILLLTACYPVGQYVRGVIQRQRQERIALGLCPTCGLAIGEDEERCPGCNRRIVPVHQG